VADPQERKTRASMADWLSLHAITAADCAALLPPESEQFAPTGKTFAEAAAVPTGYSPDEAWKIVTRSVVSHCSSLSDSIARLSANATVNMLPDLHKYPDPFTLHDGGNGYPYISCHYDEGVGSLMALAHECGHAVQCVESQANFVPPVIREVCAFLSEIACEALLSDCRPELRDPLQDMRTLLDQRYLRRYAKRLRDALHSDQQAYDYVWNYPLARLLARKAAERLTAEEIRALFRGDVPLAQLAAMATEA
jgi:hypothetical protein